nr:PHP domain-containing protein [Desulfobacula sp.]
MNRKIIADLHNHTAESDGEFTPEELVEKANSLGLKAIAVTDHDTLKALKTAVDAGEKSGMEVIPGVEISLRFKRSFLPGPFTSCAIFLRTGSGMKNGWRGWIGFLPEEGGKPLSGPGSERSTAASAPGETPLLPRAMESEDIERFSRNATRRHFALALAETFGITNRETITRILGNGSPAYLPSGIDPADIRGLIRDKGIFCALAHPAAGSFPGPGHYKEVLPPLDIVLRVLPEFLEAGIRGLEVYYPGHTRAQQEDLKTLAKKHNLILTGGSDCHDGKDRPMGVEGLTEPEYEIFKAAFL